MSAVMKKKLIPASKAAGIVDGSSTVPMQTGLTCSPVVPSAMRSVSFGSSLRAAVISAAYLLPHQRLSQTAIETVVIDAAIVAVQPPLDVVTVVTGDVPPLTAA